MNPAPERLTPHGVGPTWRGTMTFGGHLSAFMPRRKVRPRDGEWKGESNRTPAKRAGFENWKNDIAQ